MTHQIIYSSESTTPMQMDELEDLLEDARVRNAERGITGALIYVDRMFLQILEGDEAAVHALMATISRDLRHESVTVLSDRAVPSPSFGDWSMAFVGATSREVAQWAGLRQVTAIPEVLESMRQDADRTARLAEGILAALLAPPPAGPGATSDG